MMAGDAKMKNELIKKKIILVFIVLKFFCL
jgi:hypothetical protein